MSITNHIELYIPEIVAVSHRESIVTMYSQAASLHGATDLCLPCLMFRAVPLQSIVACQSVVGSGHGDRLLSGGITSQTKIIAKIILAHANSVVETVSKNAMLSNLCF